MKQGFRRRSPREERQKLSNRRLGHCDPPLVPFVPPVDGAGGAGVVGAAGVVVVGAAGVPDETVLVVVPVDVAVGATTATTTGAGWTNRSIDAA